MNDSRPTKTVDVEAIRARMSAPITEIVANPGEYYRMQQILRDRADLLAAYDALAATKQPSEPAARLEYQPGSLTEEEIAGGADIPNCLRCGRTLFGGHSHDSRWYCSSETKNPVRTDCYGSELAPIAESDGAIYSGSNGSEKP